MKRRSRESMIPSAFICMTDLLVSLTTGVIVIGIAATHTRTQQLSQEETALRVVLVREVQRAEENAGKLLQDTLRLGERVRLLQATRDRGTEPSAPTLSTSERQAPLPVSHQTASATRTDVTLTSPNSITP